MGNIYFPQASQGKNRIKMHPGMSILEAAQLAGLTIGATCAGMGKCGRCKVTIENGQENLNPPTDIEKSFRLAEKERLACQAIIIREVSDLTVHIKNLEEYEILKYGTKRKIAIQPLYKNENGKVFRRQVPIEDYRGAIYGLAVDIGTTTVVLDLVNLENGEILGTIAKTNPQISYGSDVISRIRFIYPGKKNDKYFSQQESVKRLKILQNLISALINSAVKELSKTMGKDIKNSIYYTIIAGNPVMRDIFFGRDVSSLGVSPYEPGDKSPITTCPTTTGLEINSAGEVYGIPLIGGHIGGDTVAGILACEMYRKKDICLLIDIGTNGEIVLGNKDRLIALSCAAGGAFEGTAVGCGTGSIPGAIKQIELTDEKISYTTIGNKQPVGICGSGFIDLLAELLQRGIMTKTAKITQDFYITQTIRLTQTDIYQLITAKAAIRTGWQVLLKQYPAQLSDVKNIYLSGGFGNFINIKNAITIGLIPDVGNQKVVKIGNGSLEGARELLLCQETRELCNRIAQQVIHIRPNEVEKNFDYLLAKNMYFSKGDDIG